MRARLLTFFLFALAFPVLAQTTTGGTSGGSTTGGTTSGAPAPPTTGPLSWLNDALQWSLDAALWIPRKLISLAIDGLIALVNHIAVPGWLDSLNTSAGFMSSDVLYWLGIFKADFGFYVITSAFVLRFLIRRIPFIG